MGFLEGLTIVSGLAAAFVFWLHYTPPSLSNHPTSSNGRLISWILLLGALIAPSFVAEARDARAILTEGLSTQNKVQVAVALLAAGWAALLLVRGSVRVSSLLRGPSFWITFLILLYVMSTAWSIWPLFTGFRAVELAAIWVVSKHIFSHKDWPRDLHRLLLFVVVFIWSGRFLGADLSEGLIGALRTNAGGEIAALLVIYLVAYGRRAHSSWYWVELSFAMLSVLAFGSLASFIALVAAFAVLAMIRITTPAMSLMIVPALAGFVLLLGLDKGTKSFAKTIAIFFGKTDENIATATGRIPLFQAFWDVGKEKVFGQGFGAAERFLAVQNDEIFDATNSHSGFISAWLGAGWLGAAAVLMIFYVSWSKTSAIPSRLRPLWRGILVVLFVNNLTFAGVGGAFNAVFIVMMALASAPTLLDGLVPTSTHEGHRNQLVDKPQQNSS